MKSDKALENLAESVVKNLNPRLAITPHIIQKEMGITSPRIAGGILSDLHDHKVLLKPGRAKGYYINPNQPRALSPYR